MATKRKTIKRKQRKTRNQRKIKGGNSDFNVPIHSFYPQNMLQNDTQRMTQIDTPIRGGSRKKHSRKYLRGGASFFDSFGTTNGAQQVSQQITGSPLSNITMTNPSNYKV